MVDILLRDALSQQMNIIQAATNEPLKFGNATDHTEIDLSGHMKAVNGAVLYDDMRSSPLSAPHTGARSPNMETVANDGSQGTDACIDFGGGHGWVPTYTGLDSTDEYTIEFWTSPDSVQNHKYFHRDGFIEIKVSYGDLVVQVDNSWNLFASDALVVGQTQHVVITIDYFDNRSYVYVYVNGQEIENGSMWGYQLDTSTSDVYVGSNALGNRPIDGRLDNLICYNKALTQAQVTERYNGGAGTNVLPTGIVEATDVTMRFDFNEDSGTVTDNNCTLGAGQDMTLSGSYAWVPGLLGITTGSLGVMALSFPPGVTTEIFGSIQFTHKWEEGTTIYPHPHWMGSTTDAGNVVWKFEYLWINVGDSVGGNTTIAELVVANEGTHQATDVPAGGIAGTGKKISSVLQYRFYREGDNVSDTYDEKVFLSEFDIHIKLNTMGSRQIWVK